MNRWRTVIALFAVLVWAFSAPLAMASSHCLAMGAACEGPCGASSCAVAAPTRAVHSDSSADHSILMVGDAPEPVLETADPPPKASALSA